jgi:phosphoglycolate phosphatase
MRTVIFDLDGTLADTSGDLIAAANACLRELGTGDPLEPGRDAGVAFHGGRAMLERALRQLPPHERAAAVEAGYPLLLEAYARDIDTHTTLYPGAMDAVAALRAAGCRLGICTNKPAALAELLLERLGVRGAFDSLIGADTLSVRKPDPATLHEAVRRAGGAPGHALLVGDTRTDRDTARAAGVPCVLVGFGPDGAGVAAMAPEAVIGAYHELPPVVQRLLPADTKSPA